MREKAAFAELLRQHEELTQRFARLLHDDAGQVLTAIALQLSALEGVDAGELETLQGTLDELLERFRDAQAGLGGAVVAKRGLVAGLSLLARSRKGFTVMAAVSPSWPAGAMLAGFRIVEALEPSRAVVDGSGMVLEGAGAVSEYVEMLAEVGGLVIQSGPRTNTIRIQHANTGLNR